MFLKTASREREREREREKREMGRGIQRERVTNGKRNSDEEMGSEIQRDGKRNTEAGREKRRDLPTFELSTILVISNMPHDFRKP